LHPLWTTFVIQGTLELVVTTAKTSVRAEVQARSRGLYDVTFVPQDVSPHFVNITFNDQVKNIATISHSTMSHLMLELFVILGKSTRHTLQEKWEPNIGSHFTY